MIRLDRSHISAVKIEREDDWNNSQAILVYFHYYLD